MELALRRPRNVAQHVNAPMMPTAMRDVYAAFMKAIKTLESTCIERQPGKGSDTARASSCSKRKIVRRLLDFRSRHRRRRWSGTASPSQRGRTGPTARDGLCCHGERDFDSVLFVCYAERSCIFRRRTDPRLLVAQVACERCCFQKDQRAHDHRACERKRPRPRPRQKPSVSKDLFERVLLFFTDSGRLDRSCCGRI